MKRRIIWMVLAALALVTLAGTVLLPATPPQIVTLPDGREYRFAGTSWGTNHSEPRPLAHVVDSLSDKWASYAHAKLNPRFGLVPPISTPSPALVVWLKLVGTNAANAAITAQNPMVSQYGYVDESLADGSGFVSGRSSGYVLNDKTAQYVSGGWFTASPRRSRVLEYDFFYRSPTNQNAIMVGSLSFANPLFGHFPQWQPEPVPAIKSVGDLRVHLNSFIVKPPVTYFSIYARTTEFTASFDSPHGTNEPWEVEYATLADATGNYLNTPHPGGQGSGTYSIGGALWPDESAWKLKIGLKRTNGIPAEDLITFTNLAVLPAARSSPSAVSEVTNFSRGTPVVLRNYVGFAGSSWVLQGYWVGVETIPHETPDLAVDIVRVTTDAGDPTPYRGSVQSGQNWNFSAVPAGAKAYTVTVAMQKLRYVEFLVKPPKMSTN